MRKHGAVVRRREKLVESVIARTSTLLKQGVDSDCVRKAVADLRKTRQWQRADAAHHL